jgi:hypothetical protein
MSRAVFAAAVLGWAALAAADLQVPKFDLKAGRTEKLTLRVELVQTTTSTLLPGPQKQRIERTTDYTARVTESTAAGAVIELTCDRLRTAMNVGGQDFAYDSAKDKPEPANPASHGAEVLVGAKFTLHFSADGRLEKVAGVAELLKRLAAAPGAPAGLEELTRELGDEQFRRMFIGLFLHWVPKVSAGERDVWDAELTEPFGGLGTANYKMQYTYTGRSTDEKTKRSVEKIEAAGTGRITAGAGAGGLKLSAETVERTGEIRYEPQRAWFPDALLTQSARGTISVTRQGTQATLKIDQFTITRATWNAGN